MAKSYQLNLSDKDAKILDKILKDEEHPNASAWVSCIINDYYD